jgi:hypothetical protein
MRAERALGPDEREEISRGRSAGDSIRPTKADSSGATRRS